MIINKYEFIILLLFFSLKEFQGRETDKTKEQRLQQYSPKFIAEMPSTESSIYVTLEHLSWYPNSISYKVYTSQINEEEWYNDDYIFNTWERTEEEIIDYTKKKDTLWNDWKLTYEGTKRIILLDTLDKNSYYRVKYSIQSKFSTSQESVIKLISPVKTNKNINVYIRGTGRNHHDNALIKLNNEVILKNGKFQGLAVVVLSRKNLAVEAIKYFDTYNENLNKLSETFQYIKYSYDENGNYKEEKETKTIERSMLLYNDYILTKFIKTVKPSQFLLIASCYGWEKYFTYETAELLSKFGALKIKELAYAFYHKQNEDRFDFQTVLGNNYYHHPYSFIGIKGLPFGSGFEVVQTNKGHYLSTANLPHAEIIVSLSYNIYNRAFDFDSQQTFSYNLVDTSYLHESKDYSLKNVFSLLLYANITTKINSHFNIYNENEGVDVLLPFDPTNNNNNNVYQTELDRVVLGDGVGSIRKYFDGRVYQQGANVYELPYYKFYLEIGMKKNECLPPYTFNGVQCIKPDDSYTAPILMCGIGLSPQMCTKNEDISNNDFKGFN